MCSHGCGTGREVTAPPTGREKPRREACFATLALVGSIGVNRILPLACTATAGDRDTVNGFKASTKQDYHRWPGVGLYIDADAARARLGRKNLARQSMPIGMGSNGILEVFDFRLCNKIGPERTSRTLL